MTNYPTYKLGEICELLNGFAFKSSNYVQSGLRVIRITNVKKGCVIDEEPQFYPIETQEELKKYILKKDDLLISLTGNVGRVGILSEDLLPAALNQRVGCLRVKNKSLVSLQYLFHLLNTDSFEKDCINSSKGIAQKNMSTEWLKEYEINLPPLPTQHAIVSRIESLFAELDKGVELLRTAQQQIKTYRQAVLNHWLNNEDGRWKTEKLGEVAVKIGSGSTPKGGQASYKQVGIPLIRSMNIYSEYIKYEGLAFIDDEQAKQLENVIVHEGDVLLNITGASIGRVNVAPDKWENARVNQHVCIIRMNGNYSSKFIQKYIASPVIQHWISNSNYGETRQALSKSMIESIEIPKISLSEQQRIVDEIETRLSQAEAAEARITESLQKTEALRQSILKKAFSGELVVSTGSTTANCG